MTLRLALGALTALALLAPPDARAQARVEPPGRYHIGPLWLTPRLELKNAGVDTNVFNTPDGISDRSVVLSPSVRAMLPIGERVRLRGTGIVDLNYFAQRGSERSTDFSLDGRVEAKVARFTLFAGGGTGHWKQRFALDLDERIRRQETWVTGGALLALTAKTSVSASATSRKLTFEHRIVQGTDVKDSLDRSAITGTAQFRYGVTRKTTMLLSADLVEDRFRSVTEAGEEPSARSYRYLGGLEFGPRAFVQGQLLAGMREFPSSGTAPPYRGLALNAVASFPVSRFARLTGTAIRDVQYAVSRVRTANDQLRNSYVSGRYHGLVAFQLPLDFILRTGAGVEHSDYLLPYLDDSGVRRADRLRTASATVLRAITDSIRLGVTVAWDRRTSNVPGFNYEGVRYGLSGEVVP